MSEASSLIDELQATIASGTPQQRATMLKRVADLFVAGSRRYSSEQIALFDDVLMRLAAEIETKARARLSRHLAPLPDAPPRMIRSLAFDDAIEVAAPVLIQSPQLDDETLIANARTKSQDHLYAITQRPVLSEAVTDVLVDRGDRRVVRSVAQNSGARFSDAGFGKLVVRSRGDDALARHVGMRRDIPRHHFLKLLETASASVRAKLEAANPQASAAIQDMVAKVAGDISREVRDASPEHARAKAAAKRRYRTQQLSETDIHVNARAQNFERTVVALALLGRFPVDLVERALLDEGTDMILVLVKAAGCSRSTAKSILLMHAANRGLSPGDLDRALASFDRLSLATARRVLAFYTRRQKSRTDAGDAGMAPAAPAIPVAVAQSA